MRRACPTNAPKRWAFSRCDGGKTITRVQDRYRHG
jgi:hypothetical protein